MWLYRGEKRRSRINGSDKIDEQKYQLKIIQTVLVFIIISMIVFGEFSVITICFLEVLYVLFATLDISIKYIKQW